MNVVEQLRFYQKNPHRDTVKREEPAETIDRSRDGKATIEKIYKAMGDKVFDSLVLAKALKITDNYAAYSVRLQFQKGNLELVGGMPRPTGGRDIKLYRCSKKVIEQLKRELQ